MRTDKAETGVVPPDKKSCRQPAHQATVNGAAQYVERVMFAYVYLRVTDQQRPYPHPPPPADADGAQAEEPAGGERKMIGSMGGRKAVPPAAVDQVAEVLLQQIQALNKTVSMVSVGWWQKLSSTR